MEALHPGSGGPFQKKGKDGRWNCTCQSLRRRIYLAKTRITGFTNPGQIVSVVFGESKEEALDGEWSVIHFNEIPQEDELAFPPYAFRYIYVSDKKAEVSAEYEYLPLEYRGAFHTDNEMLNRIWDVAAYTFHLNCREFILDGIKRDGWVWPDIRKNWKR